MDRDDELSQLKVLVVDDTAGNRQMLQSFLRKLGCVAMTAENGAEAVANCERDMPDMILMDVMMPVMDGYEATRRIKAMASGRWVPVVFLSALDRDENLVAGLEAGGDDYLAKPTNLVVLNAKLRSFARTLALQRRLDESRRLTQAIFDNIDDCVVTIDEQGIIQSINASARTVFGYEPAELVGANVEILMPEPMRVRHGGGLRRYVGGGAPHFVGAERAQLPGLHKTGKELLLEIGVTEMRVDDQRRFVGILRDITERAAAERKLREHAEMLQRYHDDREIENALANEIMRRQLQRPGLEDRQFHYWLTPASYFSGDIVAACRSPKGKLYAMLADGTGHGLAAAISLLPVLTTFYGLAEHDYALGYLAMEMNRQLLAFMPTGRFVAAGLVCLDSEKCAADLWVGGMPDPMLVENSGAVRSGLAPSHLPLGIVEFDEESAMVHRVQCPPGSQLIMYSDGLAEATDSDGEAFGRVRLTEILATTPSAHRLDAVKDAVVRHMAGGGAHDDISMLSIDC
jgi:two-component system, HptB-dependent secretion and biofilm response regulator